MEEQINSEEGPSQGLLSLFVVVVFAVSLVGFITGMDTTVKPTEEVTAAPSGVREREVPTARSYSELRSAPPGTPGEAWPTPESSLPPGITQETLDQALQRRQQRRAYDGAPPTIPHHVRQSSAAECMACHGEGLKLGRLVATEVPHDGFTNCTQCHVPDMERLGGFPGNDVPPGTEGGLAIDPRKVENSFSGTFPVKRGERAWPIAPPQVPHTTFMRENCMSCHGDTGSTPMRSTHLERSNCTQCHAPSATLDLRPGVIGPSP